MTALQPCGTVAAYQRHLRHDEPVCDACREANKTYQRERRANPREPRELQPCGTNAAYARHLTRGEDPCDACRKAHKDYNAAEARRAPRARARSGAITELVRRHRAEFDELFAAAMRKEGL